jgi:hypothetical protein
MFALSKAADLNYLVQGGQLYWALPFSKVSLSSYLLVWAGIEIYVYNIFVRLSLGILSFGKLSQRPKFIGLISPIWLDKVGPISQMNECQTSYFRITI